MNFILWLLFTALAVFVLYLMFSGMIAIFGLPLAIFLLLIFN